MIEIVCDNCEEPFEVDDPETAGGRVSCPRCGDVNRVPPAGRAPAARAVTGPAPPPAEEGPERNVRVVRPAMFRAHPFRYLLIALLIVGGAALWVWSWKTEKSWLQWFSIAPILFGALWWVKWWIAAHLWMRITITNKRTIKHEGIVRRHSTEVLHDHVRSVDIRQNFLQRLTGVGYIGIDSAGQDDIEINIHDLPNPYKVKEIIDRYRKM